MLNPKYKLTDKLFSNIAQIERLYGQLESMRLPQNLLLNIEKDNLVKSSYFSNSIEGNPLSLPEVTNLLLDGRIPVNRDEKEVYNYFQILQILDKERNKSFDIDLLLRLHKQLMTGVNDQIAGEIRNKPIFVGHYVEKEGKISVKVKHNPPFHSKKDIEKKLINLFIWLNKNQDLPIVIKSAIFHHEFVYIHPFEDGNGRICRLMTALLFLKAGYFINKYFVLDDYYDVDRKLYSDSLHTADKGNKTKWLEYFSDGIKYSLQSALAKSKRSIDSLSIELKPSKKEREVLGFFQERKEITSTDLADKFNISRQQAHNLLKALVEKGFVEKKGVTKSSYYILK